MSDVDELLEERTPAGLIEVGDEVLCTSRVKGTAWRRVSWIGSTSSGRLHIRSDDGTSWLADRRAERRIRRLAPPSP